MPSWSRTFIAKLIAFCFLIALVYLLTSRVATNENLRDLILQFNYFGIYLVAVISGFNLLFFPVPAATFVPLFIESGFAFEQILIPMVLGMTTGDLLSYMVGRLGRQVVVTEKIEERWLYRKLKFMQENYSRWPLAILFGWLALVPLPNELIVLPMAFLGYRLKVMLPIMIIGHFIFVTYSSLVLLKILG